MEILPRLNSMYLPLPKLKMQRASAIADPSFSQPPSSDITGRIDLRSLKITGDEANKVMDNYRIPENQIRNTKNVAPEKIWMTSRISILSLAHTSIYK